MSELVRPFVPSYLIGEQITSGGMRGGQVTDVQVADRQEGDKCIGYVLVMSLLAE